MTTKKKKYVRFSGWLTKEQVKNVRIAAKKENVSMSELLRNILDKYPMY